MNTISSLFNFLGNVLGANPNTLTTTQKTLVGAINEVDGDVGTIAGNVSTIQTTLAKAAIVEESGTDDYGWHYIKYADGRLEADKVWEIGQYSINTTENAPIKIGGDLTISPPAAMISGSIMSSVLGNTQNSPVFLEHYSDTKVRVAKVTSSNITIQGMTIGLKLLNGRWK